MNKNLFAIIMLAGMTFASQPGLTWAADDSSNEEQTQIEQPMTDDASGDEPAYEEFAPEEMDSEDNGGATEEPSEEGVDQLDEEEGSPDESLD